MENKLCRYNFLDVSLLEHFMSLSGDAWTLVSNNWLERDRYNKIKSSAKWKTSAAEKCMFET